MRRRPSIRSGERSLEIRWIFAISIIVAAVVLCTPGNVPVKAQGGSLVWKYVASTAPSGPSGGVAVGSNGKIYYFSGSAHQEYDPASDTWTSRLAMPSPSITLAGASGPDGRVYAFGGYPYLYAARAYNPYTLAWSVLTSMPIGRQGHAAATTSNGRIFVTGGTSSTGYPYTPLNSVDEYLANGSWTSGSPMPTPRWSHAAVAVGTSDGRLYVIGGYQKSDASLGDCQFDPNYILNSVEEYDPTTGIWTTKSPMRTRRTGLAAVATPDGRIFVMGGLYGGPSGTTSCTNAGHILDTVEVYNIATNTWTFETPLNRPRYALRAAFADGVIYAIGGYTHPNADLTVEAAAISPADTTPPATAADVSGTAGANGWYTSAVTVSLSATDVGSGVANTEYNLNGIGWVLYSGPVSVSAEGHSILQFRSTDGVGNVEGAQSVDIWIDTTPPTITYLGNAGTYTTTDSVAISCYAADAGSGMASDTCAAIVGSFDVGTYTYSATATDAAGNVGTGSVTFTVQPAVADPWAALRQLIDQWVTKPGIATALRAKLAAAEAAALRGDLRAKAGIIGAFINQLEAQAGKALTIEHAATLIAMARAL